MAKDLLVDISYASRFKQAKYVQKMTVLAELNGVNAVYARLTPFRYLFNFKFYFFANRFWFLIKMY